jgi:hypothetical protein
MRKLRLWVAFAIAAACVVRADCSAKPEPRGGALASVEIDNAAPNLDAETVIVAVPTPGTEPAKAGNPLWAIPLSTLSATRDRPLFSTSRRPPIAAVPPPPPPVPVLVNPTPPPAPPFTLVGTIIGGKIRIGVFLNESSKIVTRIREGEADSGWTVRSVDPRSAVLESDGRMVTLDMPEPGSAADAGGLPPAVVAEPRPGAPGFLRGRRGSVGDGKAF